MATFTIVADYGASESFEPRVLVANFGDGYTQRSADGINNLPRKWPLSFSVSPTVGQEIIDFLKTANGVQSFDWTPPIGAAGKWLCKSWSRRLTTFGTHDVSAEFVEVFE